MQNMSPQLASDRHELVAHHILRMGSLLDKTDCARAFVVIQGRAPRDVMGQIPQQAIDNPSFGFSLAVVQRMLPAAAFPLQMLHDVRQEDPLTLRFSGLAPSRNEQDCLQELMDDLAFLGDVPGLSGTGTGEVYVIGKEPLNVADRIATLHADTPGAALLKFIATVYPGISADHHAIQHIELDGVSMRRLDDWSSCEVEKLWAEAKERLLSHVNPTPEPEPDFDL